MPRKGFEPSTARVWTECSSQLSYLGVVEISGVEPLTYAVQVRRSPNWAISPMVPRRGIEPLFIEWKSIVLTTERTGQVYQIFCWSGRRGSNSRHSAWKADALPTELLPHIIPSLLFSCFGGGGWIRTNDLRVMSPTSCQLLYPAIYKWCLGPESNRHAIR